MSVFEKYMDFLGKIIDRIEKCQKKLFMFLVKLNSNERKILLEKDSNVPS